MYFWSDCGGLCILGAPTCSELCGPPFIYHIFATFLTITSTRRLLLLPIPLSLFGIPVAGGSSVKPRQSPSWMETNAVPEKRKEWRPNRGPEDRAYTYLLFHFLIIKLLSGTFSKLSLSAH